ncbi:MAG TPA: DUF1272 domain-containing protein [Gammaproteobacteria bacterium]|nr:DUF1272 domain-containing protein [Gammaproteobacteria bacterium]MDP6733679.1 DUF1272 domain-containing protein [Gammaproteobacteria bacterium]HAJ75977.1 DUF1272 domain-containing protein [Gammaproteobacteria bacterium]
MLELRPNCELCDKNLSPSSSEARICSYECTFCATCVDNVCPNCGGGFSARPIRPANPHREGVSVELQPASKNRKQCQFTSAEIEEISAMLREIPPEER